MDDSQWGNPTDRLTTLSHTVHVIPERVPTTYCGPAKTPWSDNVSHVLSTSLGFIRYGPYVTWGVGHKDHLEVAA